MNYEKRVLYNALYFKIFFLPPKLTIHCQYEYVKVLVSKSNREFFFAISF